MINVEQVLKDIKNGLENILDFYEEHSETAMKEYCALYGPLSVICENILDLVSQFIMYFVYTLYHYILPCGETCANEICAKLCIP